MVTHTQMKYLGLPPTDGPGERLHEAITVFSSEIMARVGLPAEVPWAELLVLPQHGAYAEQLTIKQLEVAHFSIYHSRIPNQPNAFSTREWAEVDDGILLRAERVRFWGNNEGPRIRSKAAVTILEQKLGRCAHEETTIKFVAPKV